MLRELEMKERRAEDTLSEQGTIHQGAKACYKIF